MKQYRETARHNGRIPKHYQLRPHTRGTGKEPGKQRLGENPAESLSDDELKAKLEELDVKLKG